MATTAITTTMATITTTITTMVIATIITAVTTTTQIIINHITTITIIVYNTNSYRTGGLGASYSTSSNNVQVTTTMAPSSNGRSISSGYTSGRNLYTSGQCTYYVFDRVGGKIGSTWGNASNWANAAARAGYTVNNTPKAGAIMQTTQGAYGHVAYVESVNSNGSVRVSEMNYGYGPGVVTSRTISASQAAGYNFIH